MNSAAQPSPTRSNQYATEHFAAVFNRGPQWLLYDFSPLAGLFRFLELSPSDFGQSLFLDDRVRWSGRGEAWTPVPFSALPRPRNPAPLGLLLHTSFCGSTLFANALYRKGGLFCLREPLVLYRIAELAGDGGPDGLPATPLLTRVALECLRRPLPGHVGTLIKPTNLTYGIAEPLMDQAPDARALVLYQSLESFLVSCLKKRPETQRKLRGLAVTAADRSDRATVYRRFLGEGEDAYLDACSVFWHVQMRHYQDLLARHPDRVAAINFDSAVRDLPAALQRAARYLFPTLPDIENRLDFQALERNAKAPDSPYSVEQRDAERQRVLSDHGRRIARARANAEALMMDGAIAPPVAVQP